MSPADRHDARTGQGARARVCIVRQRGYGELALRREAEALRDAGLDVDVVCMAEPGRPRREVVDGVVVHRLPVGRVRGSTLRYLFDYLAFFVLASVALTWLHVRRPFAAVQVSTMPDVLVFAAAVPKAMGAKVVAFMKEPTPELGELLYGPGRWPAVLRRAERAVLRWADAAITVTDDLKERFVERGADPDRITVVLNGPSPASMVAPPTVVVPDPDHFTVLCHGAIEERYGHESVVRAVDLARHRVPGLRFRIAGEGDDEPRIRALVHDLGLAEHVQVLGFLPLPELIDELRRADAGIVAQLRNGYSDLVHTNKMYEYMLFGKPVLAGRLQAVSRSFDDESICWFEAGDPRSIADAIEALAADPERRRRQVAAARRRYDAYRWERQRERYVDVFRRLGVDAELPPVEVAA